MGWQKQCIIIVLAIAVSISTLVAVKGAPSFYIEVGDLLIYFVVTIVIVRLTVSAIKIKIKIENKMANR